MNTAVQGYLGSHTLALAWTSYIHSVPYEDITTVPVLWRPDQFVSHTVCVSIHQVSSIYPIQSIHK